jgi:VanZ family protein
MRYLPALLWTALLLLSSSDLFSTAHTGHAAGWVLHSLLGRFATPAVIANVNFIVRKLTHITAYGIDSALWFRALRGDSPTAWRERWAWAAIALATLAGAVDEIHQSFVASRTASVFDVMLDSGGAALAQVLIRVVQVLLFRA